MSQRSIISHQRRLILATSAALAASALLLGCSTAPESPSEKI